MAGKGSSGSGDPQKKVKAHVLVIEASYYDDIGKELMAGAVAELKARGCTHEVVSVPGALEIPQVLSQVAGNDLIRPRAGEGLYDGAVALGCVIRGETSHYDIVCNNANHWLMQTVIDADIPFGNAILTVDTKAQAMARAQGGRKGKGADAVRACLRMIEIARQFDDVGERVFAEQMGEIEEIELDKSAMDKLSAILKSSPPKGRPS